MTKHNYDTTISYIRNRIKLLQDAVTEGEIMLEYLENLQANEGIIFYDI